MIVLQTIAVAFAMFSAIPVPQFAWNEKNMRYAMCAFPLIGVVIGAAWCVCGALPLPGLAKAAGFALVPVWITGGIHLDGYADTCDALSSYGDREKKLEILKDPRCGRVRWCWNARFPALRWQRSPWQRTPALPTPLPRQRIKPPCAGRWQCLPQCLPQA